MHPAMPDGIFVLDGESPSPPMTIPIGQGHHGPMGPFTLLRCVHSSISGLGRISAEALHQPLVPKGNRHSTEKDIGMAARKANRGGARLSHGP